MTQDLPSSDDDLPQPGEPRLSHPPGAVDTLKQAMRRARVDNAERAGVISDLRGARLVRLELLQEELQSLVAQIPSDVDIFDLAILPGASPRLFIDMIGFVEMGRDPRVYRLVQDTRHGRIVIAESEKVDSMVDAVTDYVARRLLERDKALASDATRRLPRSTDPGSRQEARSAARPAARQARPAPQARPVQQAEPVRSVERVPLDAPEPADTPMEKKPVGARRWLSISFAFVIDLLGSIGFFSILAGVAWYIWNRMHTPM